ncbi:MAG TPA: hypothetical protein VGB98_06275, partial [Pyrinomonadaceae bacterium]
LAGFDALEDVNNLLFAEPGLAHDGFSSSVSLRENSHYRCTSFRGGGQEALEKPNNQPTSNWSNVANLNLCKNFSRLMLYQFSVYVGADNVSGPT